MKGWGEEKFAERLGLRWKNWLPPHLHNPLPVKHLITIQDGSIELTWFIKDSVPK